MPNTLNKIRNTEMAQHCVEHKFGRLYPQLYYNYYKIIKLLNCNILNEYIT